MNASEIKEVFKKYEVSLGKDDAWQVQGTWVIKHSALERLAAKANVTFEDPQIIVNTDDRIVLFLRGHRKHFADSYSDWTYGEVLMNVTGANYKVSGKQAAYPWAMAEKRAKDRLIIKLAGLHGLYSEDEADDFKASGSKVYARDEEISVQADGVRVDVDGVIQEPEPKPPTVEAAKTVAEPPKEEDDPFKRLNPKQRKIVDTVTEMKETVQITDFMMSDEVKDIMASSEKVDSLLIRAYAGKCLKALGYPGKSKA